MHESSITSLAPYTSYYYNFSRAAGTTTWATTSAPTTGASTAPPPLAARPTAPAREAPAPAPAAATTSASDVTMGLEAGLGPWTVCSFRCRTEKTRRRPFVFCAHLTFVAPAPLCARTGFEGKGVLYRYFIPSDLSCDLPFSRVKRFLFRVLSTCGGKVGVRKGGVLPSYIYIFPLNCVVRPGGGAWVRARKGM